MGGNEYSWEFLCAPNLVGCPDIVLSILLDDMAALGMR
jgi:hypothetical protein